MKAHENMPVGHPRELGMTFESPHHEHPTFSTNNPTYISRIYHISKMAMEIAKTIPE
jgi:hypothetical protein